jgi:hypothetical protein
VSATPETVTAALVGARRAHQYLRLLDLGRRRHARGLLKVIAEPRDAAMTAATLNSLARVHYERLTDEQRRAHDERQAELDAMFATHKDSAEQLRAWIAAFAEETLRMITLRLPKQAARIQLFELGARTSYEGEEAGSDLRREFFGEG